MVGICDILQQLTFRLGEREISLNILAVSAFASISAYRYHGKVRYRFSLRDELG